MRAWQLLVPVEADIGAADLEFSRRRDSIAPHLLEGNKAASRVSMQALHLERDALLRVVGDIKAQTGTPGARLESQVGGLALLQWRRREEEAAHWAARFSAHERGAFACCGG